MILSENFYRNAFEIGFEPSNVKILVVWRSKIQNSLYWIFKTFGKRRLN